MKPGDKIDVDALMRAAYVDSHTEYVIGVVRSQEDLDQIKAGDRDVADVMILGGVTDDPECERDEWRQSISNPIVIMRRLVIMRRRIGDWELYEPSAEERR